jgi:hypothetical protein
MTVRHRSDPAHYPKTLREGGAHTFEIDADDIDYLRLLETAMIADPTQPFSLPPFAADATLGGQPWIPSDPWGLVMEQVYYRKGHITYYRLPNGRYCATCVIPKPGER